MNQKNIEAVVFDMDGVLLDSEPFILKAAQEMLRRRYGLEVEDAAFEPFVGMGEDAYLGGPARARGVELNMPEDKEYTYEMYLESIAGQLEALSGVHDFIAAASRAGLKLGIFSSADRMKVEGNLRETGIDTSSMGVVLTGSEVERKKPDPQGYTMAAQALGVDPERCLVVEDATMGVKAGAAAGCPCLGITTSFTHDELQEAGASWSSPDLVQLPDELLKLLGLQRPIGDN